MKTISFCILVLVFILNGDRTSAQEKPYNLIKFGIKGFGGITDTSQLNTITNEWLERVVDASKAKFENKPVTFPYNIEYGYQPFIIIRPFRLLQIGIKVDYSFSNLAAKFQNPIISQNFELTFKKKSYNPGVFAYLTLGKMELGGGVIRSYTSIDVNDNFFGYHDKWTSTTNTGYEISLGFSSNSEKNIGFTMAVKYRDLLIDDFKDNLKRTITYSSQLKNLSLNMTGFFLEMGVYFQFIKMKRQKR